MRLSFCTTLARREFSAKETIHNLTIGNGAIPAAYDHASKFLSQQRKLRDLLLDQIELSLGEHRRVGTGLRRSSVERKKRPNCVDVEPDIASVTDKGKALRVAHAVRPSAVPSPVRARRKSNALIVSNGFNVDTRQLGDLSNREHLRAFAPVATTGVRICLSVTMNKTMSQNEADAVISYRVTGMDCTSCVAKIEKAAKTTSGVKDARVSLATQTLTVTVDDPGSRLPALEKAIQDLGYRLARTARDRPESDDELPKSLAYLKPGYRRALVIVVVLNLGYGIIELIGGFIAGSQALKADALDFLGDGSISLLGLLALTWTSGWRARSALLQGWFLALLGAGVLANTAYRIVYLQTPEPELMGALGFVALVINIAAALVLLPHRGGDANARAVWLFSRNDAIGNASVVAAAGLVWWLQSPWPDLAVAAIIAGLFLHSAAEIIRDARAELAARPLST